MGGKSSSSSSSSTSTVQLDERIAATDYARVFKVEGSNNILTDHDAIDAAAEAVMAALDAQTNIALQALGQNQQVMASLQTGTETLLKYKNETDHDKDERLTGKLAPYLLAGVSILALTGNLRWGR